MSRWPTSRKSCTGAWYDVICSEKTRSSVSDCRPHAVERARVRLNQGEAVEASA